MSSTRFDVVGIGHAIVDYLVFTEDDYLTELGLIKSSMNLIDENKAFQLAIANTHAEICAGGSAANTMAILSHLGGKSAFIGCVHADETGGFFRQNIEYIGVHFPTNAQTSGPKTAQCFVFVTPDAERTMQTYLGIASNVSPKEVEPELIQNSEILYLEGYLWDRENAKEAFLHAIQIAHEKRKKVAFSLSDMFCVERHRSEFKDLVENKIDILFCNEFELQALYETKELSPAISILKTKCPLSLVTRSEKGSIIVHEAQEIPISAQKVEKPLDTTGAGDAYAAGFLFGLTKGWTHTESAKKASEIAAITINQFGARPKF